MGAGNEDCVPKFDRYVPRKEPRAPSRAAIAKVDRIEWHIVRDPYGAQWRALGRVRLLGAAAARRRNQRQVRQRLVVKKLNPLGDHGVFIINHLQPPFDKPQARQALLRMIKQTDYLSAIATDPE